MDAMTQGNEYAVRLGERLRNVRQQQGLSLHDVEVTSDGKLKASVVGAYERGERSVSVARLHTLAAFYRVPVAQLLPDRTVRTHQTEPGMRIDLTRVEETAEPLNGEFLTRYLEAIQAQRGDYNGRVLTVRASDVNALAAVLEMEPDRLREEFAP